MRTLSLLVSCSLLGLAGCGGSDPSTDLAFVSSRDGVYAIYTMSADGDGESRLTEGETGDPSSPRQLFFEVEPAWSPDGTRIAFASKRSGTFDLYVVDATGEGMRRLTSTRTDDAHPSWSPDGRRIAFARGNPSAIHVIDADGGNARRVTSAVPGAAEIEPAWSPDGRWIAYQLRRPGTEVGELWLIRPDGTGRRQLTRLNARSYEPAWSPDASRIAFASTARGMNFDIYTTGVDGEGLRRVTDSGADEFEPAWSPDGATIVFNRDGAIVAAELGGGDERELTDAENNDGSPAWRPVVAMPNES
jgi:Tol biopolymer transport system component